ncbi:MAG: glycosyltransferase family 2 protein [Methylovulum sp.]|nr:glycosyltransferase family 2 protein [Methylovulum sp.]
MIVIPMVGNSSRFFDAGYTLPKYQLMLGGHSVFYHAVDSFREYFLTDLFVFMVKEDYGAPDFVKKQLIELGIENYEVISFSKMTRGQADTVHLGLQGLSSDNGVYIFNIDTFRPGFRKPAFAASCDGYLEVFRGEGEHWSFVDPAPDFRVKRTTEKHRISDLCSDGLYYFKRAETFHELFLEAIEQEQTVKGEYYIAPLYNSLIEKGGDVRYDLIDPVKIQFCGTPDEYEALTKAV